MALATSCPTIGHKYIAPLLQKGDNPQNIYFTGEAKRWLCFTHDKRFERWDFRRLSWLFLKMELMSFYIKQRTISWMICYTNSVSLKAAVSPFLQNRGDMIATTFFPSPPPVTHKTSQVHPSFCHWVSAFTGSDPPLAHSLSLSRSSLSPMKLNCCVW
jgi:hypothetical protein